MNHLLFSLCKAGNKGIPLSEIQLWIKMGTISDQAAQYAFEKNYLYFKKVPLSIWDSSVAVGQKPIQNTVFLSEAGFNYLKQFNRNLIYGTQDFNMDHEMNKFINHMKKQETN